MDIVYIFHILLIPSFLHKTFVIESPSLYLYHASLLNSKNPFSIYQHFRYFRINDQHPQTYIIVCLNLYSNPFLKWQAHLKHFRHLKVALSHYINISSLEMDYYIIGTNMVRPNPDVHLQFGDFADMGQIWIEFPR